MVGQHWGEKVSIWWALTLCMIKDTGKCSSSRWPPHFFIPWKLSSISRFKAVRGRKGICFRRPQVEVLPAPGIQHTPINTAESSDKAHLSSTLTLLTSSAVIQKKQGQLRCHLQIQLKGNSAWWSLSGKPAASLWRNNNEWFVCYIWLWCLQGW